MLLHPYKKERLPNPSGSPLGQPFHKQPCEEELSLVIAPAPPIGTPYSIVLYSTLNDGLDLKSVFLEIPSSGFVVLQSIGRKIFL